VFVLGLAASAPAFIPPQIEWRAADPDGGLLTRLYLLVTPARAGTTWVSLPGWLAPRPWTAPADLGIGAVLGAALVLGSGRTLLPGDGRAPARRLALLAVGLLLAAFSPSVPGLRYLFAPLLVLSHPVNNVFSTLAVLAAAAAAAPALDALGALDREAARSLLRTPRGRLLMALAGAALLLPAVRFVLQGGAYELAWHSPGVVTALLSVGLLTGMTAAPWGRRRTLFAIGLLDLALFALRMHLAVPAAPLELADRADASGREALAAGYLDVGHLQEFEPFRFPSPQSLSEALRMRRDAEDWSPDPDYRGFARDAQDSIFGRAWPPHLGVGQGWRGLAGEAKMIPQRQADALLPLADRLREGAARRALFEGPSTIGARTLVLHGIPVAAFADGRLLRVDDVAPPCYSPPALEFLADPGDRMARLLGDPGFSPVRPALVEDLALVRPPGSLGVATFDCDGLGRASVDASGEVVFVVRERYHRGWVVRDAGGPPLPTFPVNQVHLGVLLPAGRHELTWRFEQPGLAPSLAAAAGGWAGIALVAGFAFAARRRRN
jgi:hypothetical protein